MSWGSSSRTGYLKSEGTELLSWRSLTKLSFAALAASTEGENLQQLAASRNVPERTVNDVTVNELISRLARSRGASDSIAEVMAPPEHQQAAKELETALMDTPEVEEVVRGIRPWRCGPIVRLHGRRVRVGERPHVRVARFPLKKDPISFVGRLVLKFMQHLERLVLLRRKRVCVLSVVFLLSGVDTIQIFFMSWSRIGPERIRALGGREDLLKIEVCVSFFLLLWSFFDNGGGVPLVP